MVFPLHVFEPRYRAMIKHCLDNQVPVAICHTEKVLHHTEPSEVLEEALNTNQDTYKPKSVFSAGPCELYETLDDGRLLINVYVSRRYRLNEITQTLPFNIAQCDELHDEPLNEEELSELDQLKDKVMHRLIALSSNEQDVLEILESEAWQTMPASEFSFAVFGLIQVDPEVQQSLLETTNPIQRLDTMLSILNDIKP